MTNLGCYQVSIQADSTIRQTALLAPAREEDLPTDWEFSWRELWQKTDFDCQGIVKLVYSEQVWGLVRFGLYPYSEPPELVEPQFLEIEQLEAHPTSRGTSASRSVAPIGKWLIWYATRLSLRLCSGGSNDTPVFLVALLEAIDYYRDIIQMQDLGSTTIGPGEDGYAFKFSRAEAEAFCRRQESQWGVPTPFNPESS